VLDDLSLSTITSPIGGDRPSAASHGRSDSPPVCSFRVDLFGRRRDLCAAMVCLWWAGINLLSVAIYCADSRAGQLTLLILFRVSDGRISLWRDYLNSVRLQGAIASMQTAQQKA
jgi:MFS family permease